MLSCRQNEKGIHLARDFTLYSLQMEELTNLKTPPLFFKNIGKFSAPIPPKLDGIDYEKAQRTQTTFSTNNKFSLVPTHPLFNFLTVNSGFCQLCHHLLQYSSEDFLLLLSEGELHDQRCQ